MKTVHPIRSALGSAWHRRSLPVAVAELGSRRRTFFCPPTPFVPRNSRLVTPATPPPTIPPPLPPHAPTSCSLPSPSAPPSDGAMSPPLSLLARASVAATLLLLAALRADAQTQTPPGTAIVAAAGRPTVVPGAVIGGHATATAAMASRVNAPPVLDARTDDPAWATAQVIDQFLEYDPNEGKETRFK